MLEATSSCRFGSDGSAESYIGIVLMVVGYIAAPPRAIVHNIILRQWKAFPYLSVPMDIFVIGALLYGRYVNLWAMCIPVLHLVLIFYFFGDEWAQEMEQELAQERKMKLKKAPEKRQQEEKQSKHQGREGGGKAKKTSKGIDLDEL